MNKSEFAEGPVPRDQDEYAHGEDKRWCGCRKSEDRCNIETYQRVTEEEKGDRGIDRQIQLRIRYVYKNNKQFQEGRLFFLYF